MLNRNSFWKNLLVLAVVTFGFYYAAPNLYAPDPALQIAGSSSTQRIDERSLAIIERALDEAGITYFGEEIQAEGRSALIRLNDSDAQLRAQAVVGRALGDGYSGTELGANDARLAGQWWCFAHEVGLGFERRRPF